MKNTDSFEPKDRAQFHRDLRAQLIATFDRVAQEKTGKRND